MLLAVQAATEYAVLTMQRFTSVMGRQATRAREFAVEHPILLIVVVAALLFLLFRPRRRPR